MARVATCAGCSAKYKVPDTVKATRTKCKKCGGVVEIPPVGGGSGAGGATAAAGAAAAPKRAPARAAGKTRSASKSAAKGAAPARKGASSRRGAKADATADAADKPAGKTRGKRSAGKGKAKGGSKGRGAKGKDDKKLGTGAMLGIIGVAVLVLGGGGWFFFGGGDEAAPDTTTTENDTGTEDGANDDTATGAEDGSTASGGASVVIPPAGETAPAAAAPDPEMAAAPAPAAAAPVKTVKNTEPRDPVLDFYELFEPVGDMSDEDFEAQTADVIRCFLDPPPPKSQRKLQAKLEELDIVDLTPSIINAFHGIDVSDPITIRDSFKLAEWWQEQCARKPHFFYDGDVGRTGQEDIDKRVIVLEGLIAWWQGKLDNPGSIDTYRETVAKALAAKKADEG